MQLDSRNRRSRSRNRFFNNKRIQSGLTRREHSMRRRKWPTTSMHLMRLPITNALMPTASSKSLTQEISRAEKNTSTPLFKTKSS